MQQSETLNFTDMDGEQKIYAAPQCEVMELELQGMIAASGDFEVPGIPGTNY